MAFYLLRHFEDEPDVVGGWSDIGLTKLGKIQAELAADYIRQNQEKLGIEVVISSDLERTRQSIAPIAEVLHKDVIFEPLWRGFNWGDLNGLSNEQIRRQNQKYSLTLLAFNEPFPNGESPHIFQNRLRQAWKKLLETYVDKNVLLCTHAINIKVLELLLTHQPWQWQKLSWNYSPGALMIIDNKTKNIALRMTHQKFSLTPQYYYHLFSGKLLMPQLQKFENNIIINYYGDEK